MRHRLKTAPDPYQSVKAGDKLFEYRRDDRLFNVGDTLELAEWNGREFTGDEVVAVVTYVLRGPSYGVPMGYVVMSLGAVER